VILLKIFLYAYILKEEVNVKVAHLSSYTMSAAILQMMEIFMELLPLKGGRVQCCHHIFLNI
jgi:hypothetical protein